MYHLFESEKLKYFPMVSILLYILKLKEYQSVGYYTQKTKIIFCCIKKIGDHTCMCQDPCIFIFTEYMVSNYNSSGYVQPPHKINHLTCYNEFTTTILVFIRYALYVDSLSLIVLMGVFFKFC